MNPHHSLIHSLLGTALGDSLGLPSEGMSRSRIAKRWKGPLEQRFLFGHGMISDDTEHTILVAQSLLLCGGEPAIFQKRLAGKLRWWFAGLPAGIGLATAKAIIKLWIGFPPGRNGVFSAGNGPVMRAPILGVYFANDSGPRASFVKASTRLRHRGDFSTTVSETIACGGDTDSVAAIAGGIAGAETEAFNPDWLGKLSDRPYTVAYITRLGSALVESVDGRLVKLPAVANWQIIPRNIVFFLTVLFHGFRRIFPPY